MATGCSLPHRRPEGVKVKEDTMHDKNFNCILHRVVEVLHFRDTGTPRKRKVLSRAEYTHARMHVHTHAGTHTDTRTDIHTRTDTRTHTHTLGYTHTRARTHALTHTNGHTHTHTHAHCLAAEKC